MRRTPEERLERAKVLMVAAQTAVRQADEIAAVTVIEWGEYLAADELDGPCGPLIDAVEFGMQLSKALDPVIVLPEPADTAVDVVVAVVAGAVALACSTRRRDPRLKEAQRMAELIVRAARRRVKTAERRVLRLERLVA